MSSNRPVVRSYFADNRQALEVSSASVHSIQVQMLERVGTGEKSDVVSARLLFVDFCCAAVQRSNRLKVGFDLRQGKGSFDRNRIHNRNPNRGSCCRPESVFRC